MTIPYVYIYIYIYIYIYVNINIYIYIQFSFWPWHSRWSSLTVLPTFPSLTAPIGENISWLPQLQPFIIIFLTGIATNGGGTVHLRTDPLWKLSRSHLQVSRIVDSISEYSKITRISSHTPLNFRLTFCDTQTFLFLAYHIYHTSAINPYNQL